MKLGVALIIFGLFIVSAALGYALYGEMQSDAPMTACTLEAKVCPDGTVVGREGPYCEFRACPTTSVQSHSWVLDPIEENGGDTSETAVKLLYKGTEYHFGKYEGSCSTLSEAQWERLEGQYDGVICRSDTGGAEVGIFEENGRLLVKRGLVEEGATAHETFRGDFIAIYTLP